MARIGTVDSRVEANESKDALRIRPDGVWSQFTTDTVVIVDTCVLDDDYGVVAWDDEQGVIYGRKYLLCGDIITYSEAVKCATPE